MFIKNFNEQKIKEDTWQILRKAGMSLKLKLSEAVPKGMDVWSSHHNPPITFRGCEVIIQDNLPREPIQKRMPKLTYIS